MLIRLLLELENFNSQMNKVNKEGRIFLKRVKIGDIPLIKR